MTIRDRIVQYLRQHPEGADDDELAARLGLAQRQQANQRCRALAAEGLIRRQRVGGKIRNFPLDAGESRGGAPPSGGGLGVSPSSPNFPGRAGGNSDVDERQSATGTAGPRPWFWEGNVQSAVATHLRKLGFRIERTADTATHEPGKDIVASRSRRSLWVTVKGYPTGTARTRASTQARHWFKDASFDIVAWRKESETSDVAIALPDFPTYRRLAERLEWLHRVAGFAILWMREDGSVSIDGELRSSRE